MESSELELRDDWNTLRTSLGDALKRRTHARGLDASELAQLVGKKTFMITKVFSGEFKRAQRYEQLADALDWSLEEALEHIDSLARPTINAPLKRSSSGARRTLSRASKHTPKHAAERSPEHTSAPPPGEASAPPPAHTLGTPSGHTPGAPSDTSSVRSNDTRGVPSQTHSRTTDPTHTSTRAGTHESTHSKAPTHTFATHRRRLAAQLKQRMRAAGMSQTQCAQALGLSQVTVSRTLLGRAKARTHYDAIACVLELRIGDDFELHDVSDSPTQDTLEEHPKQTPSQDETSLETPEFEPSPRPRSTALRVTPRDPKPSRSSAQKEHRSSSAQPTSRTSSGAKRAACYIRVSTDEQANEGVSLGAQREALRAYCSMRHLEIIELIADEGVSAAKPLSKRPGGQKLLELVDSRAIDAVVSFKLDRLFRRAAECLNVAESWHQRGVDVHLVDLGGQAVDTSSAMGKFFLTIMAGVAEMEHNLIRERTRTAMQHKIRNGEFTGVAPMGFQPDENNHFLVPNTHEQDAIARALELQSDGHSIRTICRMLDEEGFEPRGSSWHVTTLARLLKRHS